jgi:hypothetical protein
MCKIKCTMSNKSYTQQTNIFSTKISKNNMDNKKNHQQTKIENKNSPSKSSLKIWIWTTLPTLAKK